MKLPKKQIGIIGLSIESFIMLLVNFFDFVMGLSSSYIFLFLSESIKLSFNKDYLPDFLYIAGSFTIKNRTAPIKMNIEPTI